MKLKVLIPETINRMETKIDEKKFLAYLAKGKELHWYTKDFPTWAAFWCLRATYSVQEVCDMYRKYDCNDDHIRSLIIHCMKKKGWM